MSSLQRSKVSKIILRSLRGKKRFKFPLQSKNKAPCLQGAFGRSIRQSHEGDITSLF
ncbi:hypothetical protein EXN66_Car020195 [Channa argus]|uniref:Uncharacterized protein n=1 Tax=Channa argus TaxID=215402 RepID=A0A6G1QR02_CHAAH|nr:hypothetical protein EXN66_Car020195 [Channa argus]